MKVALDWLKELVDINIPTEELVSLLNSRIQGGVKEVTDTYIELDLKGYNRPDLLSLRGVAYEVAALTDSKVKFTQAENSDYEKLPQTPVKVESETLCPLYCIAKIKGLKVEKSSDDWIKKLADSGMRTVNNVADVTNLIMLEYGQPLHSFDAGIVKEETLIVRTAKEGEEIITLDGKKRILKSTDLLITDPEKAVGIAGVMGGQNSEITDNTHTILLEVAIFDQINLRRTASRLGLQSEASKRFQHGLSKKRALQALDAAIKMYQELGGRLTAVTVVDNLREKPKEITLSEEKLRSLVGVDIDSQFIQNSLEKLQFEAPRAALAEKGQPLRVKVPYFRLDIEIEEDLIEEVARIYGYEKIPAAPLVGNMPKKVNQSLFELLYGLKKALSKEGLDEIQTYSFYSTKVLDALDIYKEGLIKVANPMSRETEYLKNLLWPNLTEKVGENLKNFPEVGIFEIGKVYQIIENKPVEKYHLALAYAGESENPLAILNNILKEVLEIEVKEGTGTDFQKTFSHPTRVAALSLKGQEIGYMSEIHPKIANKFGVEKRVAIIELQLPR